MPCTAVATGRSHSGGKAHYVGPMHVAFALFADAANLSQEGKLNILGVFDAVQVGKTPAVHPRAHLVVRLKASREDAGLHQLLFQWADPHGDELWSSDGELEVGMPPPAIDEMDMPVIVAVDLPLPHAGPYEMRISIDGELAARVRLAVHDASRLGMSPRPSELLS